MRDITEKWEKYRGEIREKMKRYGITIYVIIKVIEILDRILRERERGRRKRA